MRVFRIMKQKKAIALEKMEEPIFPEDVVVEEEYSNIEDDPEIWFDYFSEQVVTAYHVLRDWFDSQGVPILDNCTFPDFAEFCFTFSSGKKPSVK